MYVNMEIKNFQLSVSYAFSMSALNTKMLFLVLFAHATISFITNGPSTIFLSETKANCAFDITLFITHLIMFACTFEMILFTTPISEMGLNSESVMGSFTLGIKAIKDALHV
ncbi:hypothetical protein HanIR_Chr04g0204321 [Helianthus annuus]|nr:hypothetical protein HanIR_Chr04g0204321 [Helianthus annuus]